jgi:ribonuclease P protein component
MGIKPDIHSEKFPRSERLKNRKLIQDLFDSGKQFRFFPLVLYYKVHLSETETKHKVLFSVPRKHFKKAIVRNKIRRKIREAFRRNKYILYNKYSGLPFLLGYVYISKNIPEFKEIESAMVDSLRYISELKTQK